MSALISQGKGKPFGWQIGLQHIFNDIKCKEMSRKIKNYFFSKHHFDKFDSNLR